MSKPQFGIVLDERNFCTRKCPAGQADYVFDAAAFLKINASLVQRKIYRLLNNKIDGGAVGGQISKRLTWYSVPLLYGFFLFCAQPAV